MSTPFTRPSAGRDDEADERGDPDVHARGRELRERDDRDGERRGDRDVDLAGDHDERQPERHQADEDVRRHQVEQVDPRRGRTARASQLQMLTPMISDDEQRLPADERGASSRRLTARPRPRRAARVPRRERLARAAGAACSCSRCVTSASMVTATTIAAPLKNIFQNSESRSSVKPSWIVATSRAPSTRRARARAAEDVDAADHDGRDHVELEARCAATASTLGKRAANMKPPSPASAPLSVNARITRRRDAGCRRSAPPRGSSRSRRSRAPHGAQRRIAAPSERDAERDPRERREAERLLEARFRKRVGQLIGARRSRRRDLEVDAAVDRERRQRGDDRRDLRRRRPAARCTSPSTRPIADREQRDQRRAARRGGARA